MYVRWVAICLVLVVSLIPGAGFAGRNTVPYELQNAPPFSGAGSEQLGVCGLPGEMINIPAEAKIYAAGAYSGKKLDYQIDQSGHQATKIDVVVNMPNQKVVLMLGAYEPTIWRVGWTKRTEILAVVVSGYHTQAVSGLPNETPRLNTTYENRGPCGYYYLAGDGIENLNPMAKRIFKRTVDKGFVAHNGFALIGRALLSSAQVETSPDVKVSDFFDASAPLAGQAGLQDALRKGILRPATKADADAWREKWRKTHARDLPPIVGNFQSEQPLTYLHNAYVIQKAFRFPAGLYGGNSATFIVPEDTPYPTGDAGHSSVYLMSNGTCTPAILCTEH